MQPETKGTKKEKSTTKKKQAKANQDINKIGIERILDPPTVAKLLGISFRTLRNIKQKRGIDYHKTPNIWGWGCTRTNIEKYKQDRLVISIDPNSKTDTRNHITILKQQLKKGVISKELYEKLSGEKV